MIQTLYANPYSGWYDCTVKPSPGPTHLTVWKVNDMRETIAAIQVSTDTPELKNAP